MQAGQNYGRTITFSAPAGLFCCGLNTNTVLVEPMDARRSDNITVFDVRAEKALPIGRTRLRVFLDLFNITNSNAAETISFSTGAAFERPNGGARPAGSARRRAVRVVGGRKGRWVRRVPSARRTRQTCQLDFPVLLVFDLRRWRSHSRSQEMPRLC